MPYSLPVRPNQCIITKPRLDKDRQDLLKRKAFHNTQKGKGDKHSSETIQKKIDWLVSYKSTINIFTQK